MDGEASAVATPSLVRPLWALFKYKIKIILFFCNDKILPHFLVKVKNNG